MSDEEIATRFAESWRMTAPQSEKDALARHIFSAIKKAMKERLLEAKPYEAYSNNRPSVEEIRAAVKVLIRASK